MSTSVGTPTTSWPTSDVRSNAMAAELELARHGERQFLLSVSHDLRTPLTSIRGYADALTDGTIPANDEERRAGAVIAAEANRLERLVADLLDLARLDAHQFSLCRRVRSTSPRPFAPRSRPSSPRPRTSASSS